MFSTIYLRLEGKAPCQEWKVGIRSEQHFTSQVTVTLEVGKVPPPRIEIGLNMNVTEQNHFT